MNKSPECYHCGEQCETVITIDDKHFCCEGCKQVYLLLNETNLCSYYDLDKNPGIKAKGKFTSERFGYLDDAELQKKIVQFSSDTQTNVTFELPQMHCSSCIFLLENLHKINEGVISSRANFQRKEVFISFNPQKISLRKVVELLAFIGYEPSITLEKSSSRQSPKARVNRRQLYRIGVAGFCFSNIMMLSFPEYFSAGNIGDGLKNFFPWIIFGLSLPVLLFSASDFFVSGFKGLRQKYVNIDAPIALAIIVTYGRSYYEIISGTGAGYLDSGTGIVFFMLVGRWFQNKTYDVLSFERDYRSYFPLGVTVKQKDLTEKNIPVTDLQKGNTIIIRNEDIVPADAILKKGTAYIDYSFVNGENTPVTIRSGELIYAGGKQTGPAIELEVVNEVSQSYITELWNNSIFRKQKQGDESFIHPWSRFFTISLFSVAIAAVIFWWFVNPANIWPALTSVLIVACPCSLLLSATFTFGNMVRIFGKNKLYLKNAGIIESLATVDTIVFDKTGTMTEPNKVDFRYFGKNLSDREKSWLQQVSNQSSHPLSRLMAATLHVQQAAADNITGFREHSGKGLEAVIDDTTVLVGSDEIVHLKSEVKHDENKGSKVNVQIGNDYKGYFLVSNHYREGLAETIAGLRKAGYHLCVLSGDNDSEKENLQSIFGITADYKFKQMPQDKLNYIKHLQSKNHKVLMIGDGLNDAGALMQADAGIAVNNNHTQFTPACDAILDGSRVTDIDKFLRFAKSGKKIVTGSFILSIIYNIVGLSFAVSAQLSPMVAAILMPASSISIVLFVTLMSNISGAGKKL
ncbi:MAG: heavy metal translocating P-type ATPase metal-binding domain-containing protein [Bacteroidetes bacterium]|nr:heavy metal translocating P-type ATPase metal-binding domain-containing protein [Bacteroidota bacterium]